MRVKREELLDILSLHNIKTNNLSYFQYICFMDNRITFFLESEFISIPFKSNFNFIIQTNKLKDILSKIDHKIEFIYMIQDKEKNKLIIEVEDIRSEIIIFDMYEKIEIIKNLDIPNLLKNKLPLAYKTPDNFLEGLERTVKTISKEVYKPALRGFHIFEDKILTINGFCLSQYIFKKKFKDKFFIPFYFNIDIKIFSKLKIQKYFIDKFYIYFFTERNGILGIKRLYEEPPTSIFEILKEKNFNNEIEIPKEFKHAIELSSIMSGEDCKIYLEIGFGKIKCIGDNEYGRIEKELNINYIEPKLKLKVNYSFLKDALKYTDRFKISKDRKIMMFKGENFTCVICLMRSQDE